VVFLIPEHHFVVRSEADMIGFFHARQDRNAGPEILHS
jgi:hypothetical protein